MRSWSIADLDLERPRVLSSEEDSRAIALSLDAGERLAEHQVHERAWILPLSGEVRVSSPGSTSVRGGPGTVIEVGASERHAVVATEDTRLLMLLTPWPGPGHPGIRREDPWSLDPLSPLSGRWA
ncbi:MAG: hypothetical protein U0R71_01065 [Solirubrobacterales bacterium]